MKFLKLLVVSICVFILAGCGEHELCEKQKSLSAKMSINLQKGLSGGSGENLLSSAAYLRELSAVKEEIQYRKISCSN